MGKSAEDRVAVACVKEALARAARKRERDREYWVRHRPALNRRRRERYARQRAMVVAAEEAAGKE